MGLEHSQEQARLSALASYDIMGTGAEASFDRIVQLAAHACRCPIALISFIDERRQWFKARVGLDIEETPRDIAFCAHAVESGETLVVEDAVADERFAGNPLVLSSPNIRFYAGVPFFASNGLPLGTVCVIDRCARGLSPEERSALAALAREVEQHLMLRRALASASKTQSDKTLLAALLVHDLRSPLTVAMAQTFALAQYEPVDEDQRLAIQDLDWAVATMHRMTINLLDICSAEHGNLPVLPAVVDMHALVRELEAFARSAAGTERRVAFRTRFEATAIRSDRDLIRRIAENLIGNALKHTPADLDVTCELTTDVGGSFTLCVADRGPGIAKEDRESIFDPYQRLRNDGTLRTGTASYGLGLAFCRLAAARLGGSVCVKSNEAGGSTFCVELPASP